MTLGKRVFDLVIIAALLPFLIPIGIAISLAILLTDGAPVFYVSERMKTPKKGFRLWKFRTMTSAAGDSGVSGGDKSQRVTKVGRFLRRMRADEIPQAVNVIRGDVSLVGPRPPLRMYVERFPDIYDQVLHNRPGLTGMASVFFSRHEFWLLSQCHSAEETDAVYARRCVPRKARLDLIYQKNRSICLDLWLIWLTAARIFRLPGEGRRKPRKRARA